MQHSELAAMAAEDMKVDAAEAYELCEKYRKYISQSTLRSGSVWAQIETSLFLEDTA